jgi:hypothetical protein
VSKRRYRVTYCVGFHMFVLCTASLDRWKKETDEARFLGEQ